MSCCCSCCEGCKCFSFPPVLMPPPPLLHFRERGFSERKFWERTVDLVAKTMISIQPSLATTYRRHFPRKRRRAGAAASSEEEVESSEEEDEDDDHAAALAAARKRRAAKSAAKMKGAGGGRRGKVDPMRPKLLEEKAPPGEDGEDSFRCFQVLGVDVLIDRQGQPHLLEINANPSLNIMHEARGDDGVLRAEVSSVDEVIKMTVVRDMLHLVQHTGQLPRDDDAAALGSLMPVVTRQTEHGYKALLVRERIRQVFVSCAGLKFDGVSVERAAFQRVARKLKVKTALADLIFVKACADPFNLPADPFEGFVARNNKGSSSSRFADPSARPDSLGLEAFTEALYDLCVADGDNSFAEQWDTDPEDRGAVLNAAVDAYFADDDADY